MGREGGEGVGPVGVMDGGGAEGRGGRDSFC